MPNLSQSHSSNFHVQESVRLKKSYTKDILKKKLVFKERDQMRTPFPNGTVIKLNSPDTANPVEFQILSLSGQGATCNVYDAVSGGRSVRLKEFYPVVPVCDRDEHGNILCSDQMRFNEALDRFEAGCALQRKLREHQELTNSVINIEGLYHGYQTRYLVTTYMNGKTVEQDHPETLWELLRLAKATTTAVGHYHSLGYLHLDVKPANLFRIPETDEMLLLFDFDSAVRIEDIANGTASFSYSESWAAPELLQGKQTTIGPATDIYAIGAWIFHSVFQRPADCADRTLFADWEFDENAELFSKVNPKVFGYLKTLFRKTLSANPKRRFQSAEELIDLLDELIELADPKDPYLVSSSVMPKAFFIGRENELTAIHNGFQQSNIQFLSGIGGIGKSELAKNYAKRHIENGDYDTVLFATYNGSWMMLVNDDNSINIANFGRIPEEKEPEYYLRKIRKLKELTDLRTLLIIDNLNEDEFDGEDQKRWEDILSLNCNLLITTRQREWSYPMLDINAFSQRDHLTALFQNYCFVKTEDDLTAVQEIIDYVGGHTLTIELVARQTKAGFSTPAKMLAKLKEHGISRSGKEKVASEKDNHQSRKTAFEHITALFDIADLSEQEKYVLANMSLIPTDGIMAERFAEWCELEDFDAVNSLIGSGWLERDEDVIKMHPVVAEVAIETCFRSDGSRCDKMLFNQIQYLENYTDRDLYNDIGTNLGDVVFFTNIAERLLRTGVWMENVAVLLSDTASFVSDFGHLDKAERYYLNALEIRRKLFGNEYRGVAICLNNLGLLYEAAGNLNDSEQYFLRALEIDRKLFGDEHPNVAPCLNNLGGLYQSAGNVKKAEQYYLEALEIRRKFFGNEHSDVAQSMNNLGSLYKFVGNIEKAEQYYLQALEIRRRLFGNEHPTVAQSLNNLGCLYQSVGFLEKAEQYLLQALEIDRKLFGQNHPSVARYLNNLGALYKSVGNLEKAERFILQSLEIRRTLFGEENPDVAYCLNNLGGLYESAGNLEKAKQHYLQTLKIRRKLFGNDNPDVAISLNNLGYLYKSAGDLEQAGQYYLLALECSRKLFGSDHPHVAIYLDNLGNLYQSSEALEEAEQYLLQALEIRQRLFGNNHPDVAKSLNNLGVLYSSAGDFVKAEQHYLQALEIRRTLHGNEHPDTATTLSNLGMLYRKLKNWEKAMHCYLQVLEIRKKLLGDEHLDVAKCCNALGIVYKRSGDLDKAEQYYLRALEISQKRFGNDDPNAVTYLNNLSKLYKATGDLEKAEHYIRKAKEIPQKNNSCQ